MSEQTSNPTSGQNVPKSKFRRKSRQEQTAASKLRMERRGEKLDAAREKLAKQKPPKKPGAVKRLTHAAGHGVHGFVHGKLYEVEHENVGTEGAHRSELVAESVYRFGRRKLRKAIREHPAKAVERAESKHIKATADYYYRKTVEEHPEMQDGGAVSRYLQKQKIKRQYAKQAREAARQTAKAAEGAITVFGENLRQLLLQPPIRGKTVMGLDPGYRMGCKVAVVDPTGKVLDTNVVYPVPEFKRVDQAKKTIKSMVLKNEVEVMAIGNGTAGHETEEFAAAVIRELAEEKGLHLQYMVVSEAGASVYSASKLAAEEFPQYDVNLRSAVSIARRLQDPLAELVKIDPKAVGVGQYQHDMPQKRLNETLDGVVEDCVNSVGVDLNTASAPLLARVAGITNATAKNIVAWREEEGAFTSRAQLKKVKGLGPKAFEQCAGFLRLPGAKNPLDATAVHPESYPAAKGLLEACGCDAKEIGTDAMQSLPVRVKSRGTKALCEALGVGEPTLMDIVSELCKPGRDVRDSLPKPLLRSDVMGLEDLKPGMELKGTVRNVIDFGAFVDIGVHQDGLVHVSQISDKFIKNPRDALKVGDVVQVKVLSVDTAKKRIALTMKGVPQS
jgi:competence ComEA-like helix-hairpin-helix protein